MTEHSYGIIPFHRTGEEIEVFLIHQYGSEGPFWTFPKGKPEVGELPEQTALRELKEETGLDADLLDREPLSVSYVFDREGSRIEKTASYFIAFTKGKDSRIQEIEVKDAGWFSIEQAKNKLTFPRHKLLLDEAVKSLDNT